MIMKHYYIFWVIVILWSCNSHKKKQGTFILPESILISEELSAQLSKKFVETEIFSLNSQIKVSGVFGSEDLSQWIISLPMPGMVEQSNFTSGDIIQKGELIAVYTNPLFLKLKRDYLRANNNLEFHKSNYSRQGELAIEQATSIKKMQEAESAYNDAEIEVKYLESYLAILGIEAQKLNQDNLNAKAYLFSGYDGKIISRNLQIGKFYTGNESIFQLRGNNELIVHFESNHLPDLKIGDTLRCILKGCKQNFIPARIVNISQSANTKEYKVTTSMQFEGITEQIKNIETDIPVSIKYYKVPFSAVYDNCWIFVQKSNRVISPVRVEIVNQEGSDIVVNFDKEMEGRKILASGIEDILKEI